MTDRAFHLYFKATGPYELVPTGWSLTAALLGPFWAFANGLLIRYAALLLPALVLITLSNTVARAFGVLAVVYCVAACIIYFPLRAFAWREQVLLSKGYTMLARIVGSSANDAFRNYAVSAQGPGPNNSFKPKPLRGSA